MKNKMLFSVILLIPNLLFPLFLNAQNIPDFRVNETVSPDGSEQTSPAISGNGTGRFVIAWEDDRAGYGDDIFAQIYLSRNTPTGGNFKVNDDSTSAWQYGTEVAIGSDGNCIIVWVDGRDGAANIYAQRYLADGTPVGSNFRVNDDSGNEEQVKPTVSFDEEGNFVIIWADKRNGNWDIYGQLYSNSGIATGTNFLVNDDLPASTQYWPCCARQADGSFIVAWADERNGNYDIYFQRFTPYGEKIGSNTRANDDTGIALQFLPEMTIVQDGSFIITWTDERSYNRDIFAQRFMNDGTPSGQNFMVNDDNTNLGQQTSYVAADPGGNFTICWEDNRTTINDIYARRYSNDGIALGESFMVNDDTLNAFQYYSGIAADFQGNFTIVWEDHRLGYRGDIFLQHYDDGGAPVLTNQKVNDDYGSENQENPSLAVTANDEFIIVWLDSRFEESDIFAQRFDGFGNFIGPNFLVNDDTGYFAQYEPSVAADAAGNAMAVWTDYRSGYPSNIYAQVYAPDGLPVGVNFQVDNAGAYMHYTPVVAASPNGGFVVTWWDTNDGGGDGMNLQLPENPLTNRSKHSPGSLFSDADVWAQRFTAEGEPIGDNFRVNDIYDDFYHYYPDVAVDDNGRFVIVWCDDRDGTQDIYFQLYTADGSPVGNNTKVEELYSGTLQRAPAVTMDGEGNFVIAWQDYGLPVSQILAQRFNHEGIPLGDIIEVSNGYSNTPTGNPDVDAGTTGEFVVSWNSTNYNACDVFAQRYDNTGSPVGQIYRLTNTGNEMQIFSGVEMQNNRIFAAWQDNRELQTGFDIWANVYEWDSWVGADSEPFLIINAGEPVLQLFPNPVKNTATISFTLQKPGNTMLQLIDGLGKKVKTCYFGELTSERHEMAFETTGLPRGLFVCTLMVDGEVIGRVKMVVGE